VNDGAEQPPRQEADPWWRRGFCNGTVLGLLVLGAFLGLHGTDLPALGHAVRDLPLAVAISAAVHLPQVLMTALAWRTLVPAPLRPSVGAMGLLRFYRESAATLLPAGGLVGQVAAARLLARRGVPAELAGATATVDLTLEAVSQVLFTLLGLVILVGGGHADGTTRLAAVGVALAAGGAAALIALQRLPGLPRLEAGLRRLARRWPRLRLGRLGDLHRAVQCLHADRRALATALCWHSAAWVLGAAEIMGVLDLLGQPVTLGDALVIESMAQALRNAGFMLPGALGVQEGAIVGAAALVGVPPGPALAAALVRRTREVLTAMPGLLAWQREEASAGRVPAKGALRGR
jgi:putative membrane protein